MEVFAAYKEKLDKKHDSMLLYQLCSEKYPYPSDTSEVFTLLCQHGYQVNPNPPLSVACIRAPRAPPANVTLVELLLSKGAHVANKGQYGRTALHWACGDAELEGTAAIVELLLTHGADPTVMDDFGKTSLCGAVCDYAENEGVNTEERKQIVRLLLAHCPESRRELSDGFKVLNQAIRYGTADMVKFLVEDIGANVRLGTPMLDACTECMDLEKVKILVKAGADINTVVTKTTPSQSVESPLANVLAWMDEWCIDEKEYIQAATVLLQAGADPNFIYTYQSDGITHSTCYMKMVFDTDEMSDERIRLGLLLWNKGCTTNIHAYVQQYLDVMSRDTTLLYAATKLDCRNIAYGLTSHKKRRLV